MLTAMSLAGVGWMLLATAAGLVVACGSTTGNNGGESGAKGDEGGTSGSGGTSGNAKAGTTTGGNSNPGVAGTATAGSGSTPSDVLTEADPNEPCEVDPLASHWSKTLVELKGGTNQVFKLGAGGPLAVLVGFGKDALLALTSRPDGSWTEAKPLPDTLGTDYPERIEVSPDGSTALVLWRRDQQMFFNLLDSNGTNTPAVELKAPRHVEPVVLSGGRVLFGYGSSEGVQLLEYTPAGGLVTIAPILTNFSSLSRDADNVVAVFGTSGLVAEPDTLYPYTFGKGFGAAQSITAHAMSPSAWQTFFFAFPNGRAARLTRAWQDPATKGLHLTTRQAGAWGTEERVSSFDGSLTTTPLLTYTQDRLLLAWEDEDEHVVAVREHDGESWQPEQVLPRSRALQQTEIVGAKASALLLGEQSLKDEQVSAKKLYRRGEDGTWYCPKLVPNDLAQLASDGEGFWFGERVGVELWIWHFKP